jgi:hypothetical protein
MEKGKKDEVRYSAGAGVESKDWFEGKEDVREVVKNPLPEPLVAKEVKTPKKVVETKKAEATTELPDLGKIKTRKLTKKDIAEQEKEYQKRKKYSEQAGKRLTEIEVEVAKIREKFPDWELVPKVREEMEGLEKERQTITGIEDEGLQAHIGLSQYIEEIREAVKSENLDKVDVLVEKAVELGRYKDGSPEEAVGKSNVIYYGRRVLIPVSETPATKAVATELRKLVTASKDWRRDAFREAVKALKARADSTLTPWNIAHHHPVEHGKVYHERHRKEIQKKDEEKMIVPGVRFTVEVVKKEKGDILLPDEIVGPKRYQRLFADLKKEKRFLPLNVLREFLITGRLSFRTRIPEDDFRNLLNFARLIRDVVEEQEEEQILKREAAAVRAKEQKKAEEKVKTPTKKTQKRKVEVDTSFTGILLEREVRIGLTADPIKM